MTEHESSRTTPRATEHDSVTTDQTTSAPQDATAYPSRADVHHADRAPRPRFRLPRPLRGRKAAVPVALTVTALSTGMAAGVATAASGSSSDAPAETTTTTVAGGTPDDRTQTAAVGTITPAASSPDTAKAEAALSRAEHLSTTAAELTTGERKKVAALADDVRAIVEDAPTGDATPAASRSTEREPLAERTAEAPEKDAAETDEDGTGTTESAPTGQTTTATIAPAALAEAPGTVASVGATGDLTDTDTDTDTATAPDRDADAASRDSSRTERPAADASGTDAQDELADKTTALKKVLDEAENATVDIEPAPPEPKPAPAPEPAPAESAEKPAAPAEDRRGSASYLAEHADDTKGYGNGEIPSSELCELSFAPGELLRCDATAQLEKLDAAYHAAFGAHLEITDSYRSYAEQVAVQASRGYLAAAPGTSNHGWAVAVDLGGGVESFGSAQYQWLQANGAEYGWQQPGWAQAGGSKPEAWHWEYKAP